MCYTLAEMIYIFHTFWKGQGAKGRGQREEGRKQREKGDHFVFLQMFYKNLIYLISMKIVFANLSSQCIHITYNRKFIIKW